MRKRCALGVLSLALLLFPEPAASQTTLRVATWNIETAGSPGSSDSTSFPGGGTAALLAYAQWGEAAPRAPQIFIDENGNALFTFSRNIAADDVELLVEISDELKEWTLREDPGSSENPGDGTTRVTVPLPAGGTSDTRFIRLRATLR